jgi:hypothetical protein
MEGGSMILGIDPGNKETALVLIDEQRIPLFAEKIENGQIDDFIYRQFPPNTYWPKEIGIECISSYGMAVGAEVFETAEWSGRIRQLCRMYTAPGHIWRVYRKQVKLNLCGTHKAKDGNIRQALIDRYPAIGGGKIPQIGTKKEQGPLYGLHSDLWAALAVAHTVADMKDELTNWK